MRRTSMPLVALLASAWLVAAAASPARASAPMLTVAGGVFGTGAAPAGGVTGSGRAVLGTVGQPVVGASTGATKNLCHGFWCGGGVRVVSVDDAPDGGHAPKVLAFGLPSPNPMTDRMRVSLSLPAAAEVRVDLHDVQGRLVGGMHAGRLEPGVYQLEWDGTDGDGRVAGPGVYFARMLVDGRLVAQHRLVRLR